MKSRLDGSEKAGDDFGNGAIWNRKISGTKSIQKLTSQNELCGDSVFECA
jgi:hypothetical protein